MEDQRAALRPHEEIRTTARDQAMSRGGLSESVASEDGELHDDDRSREQPVDGSNSPNQRANETQGDEGMGTEMRDDQTHSPQNALSVEESAAGSAHSWLPRGDLHESSPAQQAPPQTSCGSAAARRIRDLTPRSANQVPLPVSMFCVLRDDPPPPSHVPYEYLVFVPFRSIGPVVVGTGGRTKRRICDVSNLAEMRVLFTLDGKCFLQLFGSKSSIIDALNEIRQLVFRSPDAFWNAWEENELRRRGDEWTRWSDQRAERVPGAWLLDSYSSSLRPEAPSISYGTASSSRSRRDFESNRWAHPAQSRFRTTSTHYKVPATHDRFVGAPGNAPRSPPSLTSPHPRPRPSGELKPRLPHYPELQQNNDSLSSMDLDSGSSEAQVEAVGKARDYTPVGRKRNRTPSPAGQQGDGTQGRARGGVPSPKRVGGRAGESGGSRRRSIDMKATTLSEPCAVAIPPSAIGHFVGLTSCIPYIELVAGSAIKVEATTTSSKVIIEGGNVPKAKEMVEGVAGKDFTASSSALPSCVDQLPRQRSTRMRDRSISPKSSPSTDYGGQFDNSIPAARTSPDTSFGTFVDDKGTSEKRLTGEALERQLRDAAREIAMKRRKRREEDIASLDSASETTRFDRTRQWIDGVDRSTTTTHIKGSAAHDRGPESSSNPSVERASRRALDASVLAGPRVVEQPPPSEPKLRRESPRPRPPPPAGTREHRRSGPAPQHAHNGWHDDRRRRGNWSDDRWEKGTGSYRPEHDPVNVRGYGWGEKGWHQTYSYGRERGGVNR